jgi:hypothetical protein
MKCEGEKQASHPKPLTKQKTAEQEFSSSPFLPFSFSLFPLLPPFLSILFLLILVGEKTTSANSPCADVTVGRLLKGGPLPPS